MRGHEEASGTKYVPQALLDFWAAKDPVENYQTFLKEQQILSVALENEYKEAISKEINEHLQSAFEEEKITPNYENELNDVYKSVDYKAITPSETKRNIRFIDAISDGLRLSMQHHEDLILMGQDIAEYGGAFKITEGFVSEFGNERVKNTPICESAIVSAAYGLSVNGMKSVVEMQFADFVSSGFNPIVNLLAKSHYRWQQIADVVVRMPCGAGVSAGPFHSQTNEAWFTKTPGLKVVYPAFPQDAKGLLISAINDPNPVLFFEHKALYRAVYQDVSEGYFTFEMGKGNLLKEGKNLSIISYGAAVHWVLDALKNLPEIEADVIDLRTLQPLDTDMIFASVKKTGKVLIAQEDSLFGGIASDISALITENCFEFLDAPIKRVGSMETPIPFQSDLEQQYLGKSKVEAAIKALNSY
jgi:2-oxoisovalerate dehydrogenase E1 component